MNPPPDPWSDQLGLDPEMQEEEQHEQDCCAIASRLIWFVVVIALLNAIIYWSVN